MLQKLCDRVNYVKQFAMLITRNLLAAVLRFLFRSYLNHFTRVNQNNVFSNNFHVYNGVRLGDILSPVLFNIYIDGLFDG